MLRPRDSGTTNTSIPSPISISASQFWSGNDGSWSTFPLQIGTPPQMVEVMISTAATSSWVMDGKTACPPNIPITNCPSARGTLFNVNQTLTWVPNSIFTMELDKNLGLDATATYGFDTVELGFLGSGGPSLPHQIAGITASNNYFMGGFGLNPRPTNFSTFNSPQASFMQGLRSNNSIPSVSWSYTAGAPYRFNKVLGSLTLGGYDASLQQPTNLTFPFNADTSRDLSVGIQSISTNTTSASLLPSPIYATIDTTFPWIWLPQSACEAFEQAFNLTFDSDTSLYLLSDAQHKSLLASNPSVTFTIGPDSTPGTSSVDITFPYSAFDLQASWPLVDANTTRNYFPLKRAANDTQYVLGRAFLQEAVLTADYERMNFTVAPRKWTSNPTPDIKSILSPNYDSRSATSGLSTGAIVGIAIGAVAVVAALVGLAAWLLIRRRRERKPNRESIRLGSSTGSEQHKYGDSAFAKENEQAELESPNGTGWYAGGTFNSAAESDSHERYELHNVEKAAEVHGYDRPKTPVAELASDTVVNRAWWDAVNTARGRENSKGG